MSANEQGWCSSAYGNVGNLAPLRGTDQIEGGKEREKGEAEEAACFGCPSVRPLLVLALGFPLWKGEKEGKRPVVGGAPSEKRRRRR